VAGVITVVREFRSMLPGRYPGVFVFEQPGPSANRRGSRSSVSPVGARWRLCPQGQPPSTREVLASAASEGSSELALTVAETRSDRRERASQAGGEV
jgi:hypothetical protein